MAKTAAMAPAMGAQGTMRKKSKKMRLLRNPFSDTEAPGSSSSSSPSSFRNPFCDSFALIHTYGEARASETEGDEDGEEDEARIMQARRQALVALDPNNRDSWKAEFKSLKEYSLKKMSLEQQRRQELELSQQHQQQQSRKTTIESSHEALEVLDEPPPDQGHEEEEEEEEKEDQAVLSATPPRASLKCPQESSDDSYDPHNRNSRNSLFSTPRKSLKRQEADVPEISISLPTPPPSSSTQNHSNEPSCDIVADPSLLSTTYTPSPLSSFSLDPLDASWQQNLSPEKAKAKERRTTVVYRSLLQRVSPSTPVIVRPIVLSAGSTADSSDVDALGAQIEGGGGGGGTMTPKPLASSSWSLNRNTFGAFSKLDQRHHHHDEQDQQQPFKQKFKQSSRLFRKQRSSRHALDPWDSSDDMLIQVTDDDDGNDSETPHSRAKESFLKGRVGVRRTEAEHVSRAKEKGSVGAEDWIVHPRTAAIKGTFHRVHEAVPVPSKDSRPSSLGPELLTMSLSSPPRQAPKHQTFGDGAASLTRAQSTDSPPVTPLRKGASAFLSGFGTASLKDSGRQAMMNKDMAESTQIRRMMNGQALPLAEGPSPEPRPLEGPSQPRSSMMTFGTRMSTNSPPRITLSSSFASFRDLISSATGLVRSSSSVSENAAAAMTTMFAPFSPATNLSRAQSTVYVGGGGGGGAGRHSVNGVHSSGTGGISFSPGSRRKTALVMMAPPTIVVAQKVVSSRAKDEEKRDLDASSMHTISSSSNTSASSSFTMLSSGLEQHQPRKKRGDEKEEQEGTGLEDQGKYPESKKLEFNQGHAAPSTPLSNISSGQRPATTTTTPRHHSLLKVPEPAKAGSSSQHHHHHHPHHPHQQHGPPTSVAASAMAAAQRAWLSSLGLTRGERELIRSTSTSSMAMASSMDSLAGPLTGDDYIGQFERERAKARGMMMKTTTTNSAGSLGAEAETLMTAESSSATLTTASEASDHESHANSRDWKKNEVGADETHSHAHAHKHGHLPPHPHPRPRPPPIRRSHTSPKTHKNHNDNNDKNNNNSSSSGIRRSFLQTIRIRRESSGPLDMSDRLMHLPEPSRFEGMCSCRGVINIASMLLILLGLVLLILGYPIATSLNKDRVAAEAAAGISATAPATSPGADVL
ncbi:hypothetical protein BGZ75_007694, partial [Mortierella antarctica]